MHALDVLEFDAVRLMLADRCETPPGREAALALCPAFTPLVVWAEQEKTAEAFSLAQNQLPSWSGIRDISPTVKVASKGGVGEASLLASVGVALVRMTVARALLQAKKAELPRLAALAERLPDLPRLAQTLEASLDQDGTVLDAASPELAQARQRKARAGQRILERIQTYVSGKTRAWLSDPLYTTRGGRYVIPLKADYRGKVKGIVHDTSASGQTIFVEPEDVVALGNALREAEGQEKAEEYRVLAALSAEVGKHADEILEGFEAAVEMDVLWAKARLGIDMDGCLPGRLEGPVVRLTHARHPMIPKEAAVPLSLRLGEESDVLLITGPNTGGKTVSIKTVGLAVLMAQAGMMVCAFEAKFGNFTQVWADIGDEQSLQQSLSTFSGHIKNIAEALKSVKAGALVLLDEVGAGTDPAEGAALARAVLLEFQKKGAKVMASTHYGELKVLASNQKGFLNASMEFDVKSLRPTYRFMLGTPGSSHALKIAERYGIPAGVVEAAAEGVTVQEQDLARMIEKLEQTQRQAQRAQGEADRLASRLREVEKEAERKVAQAEETRLRVRQRASDELEEILRQIRIEASDVFESVKRDPSQANLDRARERMRGLQDVGTQFAREMKPAAKPEASIPVSRKIEKGMTVTLAGLGQKGVVLDEPKGKTVMVQVGAIKMSVAVAKLVPAAPDLEPRHRSSSAKLSIEKAQTVQREIHLRNMAAEDAKQLLEKFLDDAVLAGAPSVRIVHGKGEGILRSVTQTMLRKHRDVKSFQEADANEGGQGVTIAQLQ